MVAHVGGLQTIVDEHEPGDDLANRPRLHMTVSDAAVWFARFGMGQEVLIVSHDNTLLTSCKSNVRNLRSAMNLPEFSPTLFHASAHTRLAR